jgi:hypothetical protein
MVRFPVYTPLIVPLLLSACATPGTSGSPRTDPATGGIESFELTVSGNRITGPGTDVTFTQFTGGFRLTGLWSKFNVDLPITDSEAVTQMGRSVRQEDGAYPQPDWPRMTKTLVGEAENLSDPAWPQLPLMMLVSGWGVRSLEVRVPGAPVIPSG